ncbi:MAG: amidohydrolase family protein [Bacteriovoracaceae bacterium]|nr:amidohydrolase family protein [Bacteriovoracaceae bacterium]
MIFNPFKIFVNKLGGNFLTPPELVYEQKNPLIAELIDKAFTGFREGDKPKGKLLDIHTHIVGLGNSGSGAFVNPAMQTWKNPMRLLKFNVYKSATGIKTKQNADEQYLDRIVSLAKSIKDHGLYTAMAFDKHYDESGKVDLARTEFYTPNEYVYDIYKKYPDVFIPMISVHPYRLDAIYELEKWAKQGVKYVKWLPNAMGIDPSSALVKPFYQVMMKYDMTLLCHIGNEKAVKSTRFQHLGNPLLLRYPLELGVNVILAHCGSLGSNLDLESWKNQMTPNFNLFLRLMDEQKYVGKLFADISAIQQRNRYANSLASMLERFDLHPRLINGSDYPMPAINTVVSLKKLAQAGFITTDEASALNTIYRYNPLLFDFVLKSTVRHPKSKRQFSKDVFVARNFITI